MVDIPINAQIRVLVVDDHPMMRAALCSAIDTEPDMRTVGTASDGFEAVQRANQLKPDVIVMDLLLPEKSGFDAIAEIKQTNPDARVLAITSSVDGESIKAALQAGALGYILKDMSREAFITALQNVARGEVYLPPAITEKLVRDVYHRQAENRFGDDRKVALTGREQEIMELIGQGLDNRSIARKLFISESTVRVHISNLLIKLNLDHRSQIAVYASNGEKGKRKKAA